MKKNWGFCEDDAVRTGIVYPGQSPEDAAMATRNQGGWYNSMDPWPRVFEWFDLVAVAKTGLMIGAEW